MPDAPGPGLPALISPVLYFSDSLIPPKLIIAVCWLAALVFAGLLARKRPALAKGGLFYLVVPLAALLPAPARFANQVLSDLPFAAAMLAAILFVTRLQDRDKRRARLADWAQAGAVIAVAFLFRQAALAVWAGCALALALEPGRLRRDRAAAVAALSAGFWLLAGAWLLRNYVVAGSLDPAHAAKLFSRDGDPFAGSVGLGDFLLRAPRGVVAYFRETGGLLLDMAAPLVPLPLRLVAAAFFVLPALYGLAAAFRRRRGGPLEWSLVAYLALVSVWQSHNPRYLIPLLPLLIILWLEGAAGLAALAGKDGTAAARLAAAVMAGLCIGVMLTDVALVWAAPVTPLRDRVGRFLTVDGEELQRWGGTIEWGRWYQYPDFLRSPDPLAPAVRYHRLIAAARWLSRLPPEALVVTRKPPLVAWYSGRHTLQYPPILDPDRFVTELKKRHVTHLVLDEVSGDVRVLFGRARQARPEKFRTVYSLGGTEIIEFRCCD